MIFYSVAFFFPVDKRFQKILNKSLQIKQNESQL